MSLRLELSRGAALRATTLKAFVRGVGVTGFPRWRNGGPGQSPRERSTLRHNEGTACDLRSMTRQAFGPDVRGIHGYMRDSEVYHEIVTTLSSTYICIYVHTK